MVTISETWQIYAKRISSCDYSMEILWIPQFKMLFSLASSETTPVVLYFKDLSQYEVDVTISNIPFH